MSAPVVPPVSAEADLAKGSAEAQGRKRRLMTIVNHGLPPFPHTAMELTKILSGPAADIKKAGKLIRTDPSLSAQVLRLCNSPLFGLRSRVISIEQAAVLLGSERLRTLSMTSSLVNFAGKSLPSDRATDFWQHCFLAAMLCESLAKKRDYFEKEQAYIAGLLHDIGQVPQWLLVSEEKNSATCGVPEDWRDNPFVEVEYFGIDHCEAGSAMVEAWNFLPSFIDVLDNHHSPELAQHDKTLVQIVATAEYFLLAKEQLAPVAAPAATAPGASEASGEKNIADAAPLDGEEKNRGYEILHDQYVQLGRGLFSKSEWERFAPAIEEEYQLLIPVVQSGMSAVLA